jgi:hypothetical protein
MPGLGHGARLVTPQVMNEVSCRRSLAAGEHGIRTDAQEAVRCARSGTPRRGTELSGREWPSVSGPQLCRR